MVMVMRVQNNLPNQIKCKRKTYPFTRSSPPLSHFTPLHFQKVGVSLNIKRSLFGHGFCLIGRVVETTDASLAGSLQMTEATARYRVNHDP